MTRVLATSVDETYAAPVREQLNFNVNQVYKGKTRVLATARELTEAMFSNTLVG